jgi:ATP-dependent DNA ligase
VNLPVNPPLLPMLAKRVDELPPGEGWIFEPKWDGFRALVFRDGDELLVQSRDEKPLNRYFPELVESLCSSLPPRCVLDGEIVIVKNNEPT